MKNKLIIILAFCVLAIGVSSTIIFGNHEKKGASPPTPVVIPATADVHVELQKPDNHEGAVYTLVGLFSPGSRKYYTLIEFRTLFKAIPKGSSIKKAVLRLYTSDPHGDPPPHRVILRRIDGPWDPATVNGLQNSMPQLGNQYAGTQPALSAPAIWNVTQLVQDWVDSTHTNYGLVLTPGDPVSWYYSFHAMESPSQGKRPRLLVTYE